MSKRTSQLIDNLDVAVDTMKREANRIMEHAHEETVQRAMYEDRVETVLQILAEVAFLGGDRAYAHANKELAEFTKEDRWTFDDCFGSCVKNGGVL